MLQQSFMHIAYYCALLCSLYQLQLLGGGGAQPPLAQAITIIIDGASAREWPTRDGYKRLIEQAQDQQQQQQQPELEQRAPAGQQQVGARASLAELVAPGDAELIELAAREQAAARQLAAELDEAPDAEAAGPRHEAASEALDSLLDAAEALRLNQQLRRGTMAPKKYCGPALMEMLDNICESRYAGGTPQIVQPSVIMRRHASDHLHEGRSQDARLEAQLELDGLGAADAAALVAEALDQRPAHQHQARAQRRLRETTSLAQRAPGNPMMSISNSNSNINDIDNNYNQAGARLPEFNHDGSSEIKHNKHQYLSPSSSLSPSSTKSRSLSAPSSVSVSQQQQQQQQQQQPFKQTRQQRFQSAAELGQSDSSSLANFSATRRRYRPRRVKGAHTLCCANPCDPSMLKDFCEKS